MALSVIGAGFGRTGTHSMKLALEQLGLGRCHHMMEVRTDPDRVAFWLSAVRGEPVDWDREFAGFGCAIDWPSAAFWRQIAAHYPEAKVLLTVRASAEDWYRSFSKTILPVVSDPDPARSPMARELFARVFGGRAGEPEHAMAIYRRNIADAQAAIPPGRLLTYTAGDGWAPLCRFLGLPVPDAPFPHSNTTDDFLAMIAKPAGPAG